MYIKLRGHVETVHAFTNDQNLIDNFHKGDRRGRSAVLNMVSTETGAAVKEAGRILVVEGYMDVVALAQFGIGYGVAALDTQK